MQTKIIIATRASPLALVQANQVKSLLEERWPGLIVELLKLTTLGDKILDKALREIGGKGLFVKEIEEALLNREADLAVHSMKDVPADLPEGLMIPVILKREDPRDALVSEKYATLQDLPPKSIVGTTSLRRKLQLLKLRPDLKVVDLRGNVDTRLRKLKEGEYDAIILATAGLNRLGISSVIREKLSFICAPGQGAVGIQCRSNDEEILKLIAPFNDEESSLCLKAERVVLKRLEGGCELPVGAYAHYENQKIRLQGFVADPQGKKYLQEEVVGAAVLATELGEKLSEILLAQGAAEIINEIRKKS